LSDEHRLRIRAYNVQFGDAFLVSFSEKDQDGKALTRNILIDVGNLPKTKKGGCDKLFKPIVDDVLRELKESPLDLYVMTHEHLDHVQGLPYAEEKCFKLKVENLKEKLDTQYAWLTASSKDDYYEKHPDAQKKRRMTLEILNEIRVYLNASLKAGRTLDPVIESLWLNNNPMNTDSCVQYLRGLAKHPCYVSRSFDVNGNHPFKEIDLEIWAPEEDTAEYYRQVVPVPMYLEKVKPNSKNVYPTLEPPPGVDVGSFYNLVNYRQGYIDNMLMIDRAANNTSVVLCLKWRGLRLLFPGDAEQLSWIKMVDEGAVKPVQFLKVSHHGSSNGTPGSDMLDLILPKVNEDGKKRCALVSTWQNVYPNVPDDDVLTTIRERCDEFVEVYKMAQPGSYVDIEFNDEGWVETKKVNMN